MRFSHSNSIFKISILKQMDSGKITKAFPWSSQPLMLLLLHLFTRSISKCGDSADNYGNMSIGRFMESVWSGCKLCLLQTTNTPTEIGAWYCFSFLRINVTWIMCSTILKTSGYFLFSKVESICHLGAALAELLPYALVKW